MRQSSFLRLALCALILAAMTVTGLAHRAPSLMAEQLRLMGASPVEICGMGDMAQVADPCPLCRVDPGFLPPDPVVGAAHALELGRDAPVTQACTPAPVRVAALAHRPRAPPLA